MALNSPVINKDNSVTFYYENPKAKKVQVGGFFSDWVLHSLKKNKDGIWAYTSVPLAEGTYTYVFRVDEVQVHDPLNPKQNKKPSGHIESILDIGKGDYYIDIEPQQPTAVNNRELVVLTLNTHSFQENTQRFQKLLWIAEGIKNANVDLVALNEVVYGKIYSRGYQGSYYNTGEIIQDYVQKLTGRKYYLYMQPIGRWNDGENLGNAILSKFPLQSCDYAEITTTDKWPAPLWKRNCIFARVQTEKARKINFFVTHAMGWNSRDTYKQIQEIKRFVISKRQTDTYAEIIAGDFNILPIHKRFHSLMNDYPQFIDTYGHANSSMQLQTRIDYIFVGQDSPILKYADLTSFIIFNDNAYQGLHYPKVSDHFGFVSKWHLRQVLPNHL